MNGVRPHMIILKQVKFVLFNLANQIKMLFTSSAIIQDNWTIYRFQRLNHKMGTVNGLGS